MTYIHVVLKSRSTQIWTKTCGILPPLISLIMNFGAHYCLYLKYKHEFSNEKILCFDLKPLRLLPWLLIDFVHEVSCGGNIRHSCQACYCIKTLNPEISFLALWGQWVTVKLKMIYWGAHQNFSPLVTTMAHKFYHKGPYITNAVVWKTYNFYKKGF